MAEEDLNDDMGGDSGESVEAAGSAGASKLVKILLFVVGGIAGVFVMFLVAYTVSKYVQEKKYERDQDIVVAPPPPPLAYFSLPEFAVTTKDAEPHFAKITIALGYQDNVELNTELIRRTIQIQHLVNIILRGKRKADLDSIEDSVALAEEVKAHVNVILISGKIKEVYFKEFIVN